MIAIRRVIRPLVNLTDMVKALGRGLPVEPVPVETTDEVGNLAASFNETVRARSEAEGSLRESEERYRRLVDLSPDVIYVQHRGAIQFINPSGLALLGASDPAQVIGQRADDFLEENCRSQMARRVAQVEEEGIVASPLHVRYLRPDGTTVEAEVAIAPFPFGRGTAALVIARDESERKGMEEQIRVYQNELFSVAAEMSALESKVEERERHLIATDLHDYVGQNLAALAFMTGRLQRLLKDGDPRRIAHEIGETLQQTIEYTRSLTIELSPPILTELGLKPALDALAEAFRKTHGMAIRIEDDGRTKEVPGEARYLLFRCVRELLLNAVKHAKAEEVTVRLASENGLLRVIVEDNGTGFAKQNLSHGGFGLFSVQERLKRLGGACVLDSCTGQGNQSDVDHPPHGSGNRGGSMTIRILIADDHKLMREGLRTLIAEQPNMEVVAEAEDGETASQAAEKTNPDIIIMDISMPGLNGIEATRMVVGKNSSLKVIALSMHYDTRMVLGMFDAGAAGYLLKDCAFDEVIEAIDLVSSGGGYLSSRIAASLVKEYALRLRQNELEHPAEQPGRRDREILELLTQGRDNKTIASELHLSQKAAEAQCRQAVLDHVVPLLSNVLNIGAEQSVLTAREREILLWVKEGKNNWEIASILDITPDTVKFHLKNIYQKLNVANRSQAIAAALERKLIDL